MKWKERKLPQPGYAVQTGPGREPGMERLLEAGQQEATARMYREIRKAVPIIDAAIGKIIRLTGDFTVHCASGSSREAQEELEWFCREVPCGACGRGLRQFLYTYLDDLLTVGNAVGEMVPQAGGEGIGALYNVPLEQVCLQQGESPLEVQVLSWDSSGKARPVPHPERVVFSALNPPAGSLRGRSLLEGLPGVAQILLQIYDCIGKNFERMGNLRYAVTCRPGDGVDGAYAREIAQNMAEQWARTMAPDQGRVRDFVAVGDVEVKVIGADCQMMDTQVPARQMLEQMVAKLGVPPFILGLSWSTTERMSKQQADILVSELESYRALLTPVIRQICQAHLEGKGWYGPVEVRWSTLRIADEVEEARAQLLYAQAEQVQRQNAPDQPNVPSEESEEE